MSLSRHNRNRRKSSQLLGFFILVLAAATIVAVGYLLVLVARSFTSGAAPEVTVPDVVGISVEEAEQSLNSVNLGILCEESAYSSEIPAGAVISQSPLPGDIVREGRRVRVVRSLGKPSLKVPELGGKDFKAAQEEIMRSGLALGLVKKVYTKRARRGEVIHQAPPAGKVFTSPVKVDLTIASAEADMTVPVPALVGRHLSEAEAMLHQDNLAVGRVSYRLSETSLPGEVLAQTPEAGNPVQPGTAVSLEVAIPQSMSTQIATTFRFRFQLPPALPEGDLKLEIEDSLGRQVVFNETVKPGELIEQAFAVQGKARVRVYLDGRLLREDLI